MRRLLLALLLVLLAAPSPSQGQASRLFNGSDDTITMGDVLDFQRTDPFSISCLYKMAATNPTTVHGLITKIQGSGSFLGWALDISGTQANDPLRFLLRAGVADRIHALFPRPNDTLWHQAGCGYDGSQDIGGLTCYVDGASATITTEQNDLNAGSSLTTEPLRLGSSSTTAISFLAGNLAYCQVHNVKLRADEFAQMRFAPLSVVRGRVGCWHLLDNGTTPTYQDCSGAGLTGSASNHPDGSSDGPAVMISGGGQ